MAQSRVVISITEAGKKIGKAQYRATIERFIAEGLGYVIYKNGRLIYEDELAAFKEKLETAKPEKGEELRKKIIVKTNRDRDVCVICKDTIERREGHIMKIDGDLGFEACCIKEECFVSLNDRLQDEQARRIKRRLERNKKS